MNEVFFVLIFFVVSKDGDRVGHGGRREGAGRPKRDLTNLQFGKIVAVEVVNERKDNHALWRCRCECGRETFVSSDSLIRGSTKSCGSCSVNTFEVQGDICIGKTTNGVEFIFDAEFLPLVSKYSWNIQRG